MPETHKPTRRDVLQTLALTPICAMAFALPAALAEEKKPAITIDGIEVFQVKANSRPKILYSHNWILVRVKTDRGLTGLGEASQSGKDALTLAYLKKFSALLQGRGIYDIEWLRSAVAADIAKAGPPAAVAANALEHALWDIRGKVFGIPCYEFFGGTIHAALRQYANINRSTADRTPEGFAKTAQLAVAAGLTAVKLAPFDEIPLGDVPGKRAESVAIPHIQQAIQRVAAVRAAIGPKIDLLVDMHSRLSLAEGLDVLQRLAPYKLFWVEEVVPPDAQVSGHNAAEQHETYAELAAVHRAAAAQGLLAAGGEDLNGVGGFYPYIAADAAEVYMPDVKRCGGMLEMKKIAAIAEGAGRLVSPHGPASPVGNVIGGQVMTTAPNFNILEMSFGENPWRSELISPPEDLSSGKLHLGTRPGLGITLNEATAAKYAASSVD